MPSFISVNGPHFEFEGAPYRFIGTNFWQGMHLAAFDRPKLLRELEHLKQLGITNLRLMASSEGPDTAPWRVVPSLQPRPGEYHEALLKGLDFLLAEMGKRGLFAVLCLGNFWPWSGGMSQYLAWHGKGPIPYPPPAEGGNWAKYALYTSRFFYHGASRWAYEAHVRKIVTRINSLTGIPYRDDPTIMTWQLANEPRGMLRARAYRRWIRKSAALIKSLDPNHLVSIGSEGRTATFLSGTRPVRDHRCPGIDYMTCHIWVQNWGWYDPLFPEETYEAGEKKALKYLGKHVKKAQKLGMPLVLEEFGIARDSNAYEPSSGTAIRDRYYKRMFEEVLTHQANSGVLAGINFWAWAGESRPPVPGAIWKTGDSLIGDPPHEHQGWYSVYDSDKSTLAVIEEAASIVGETLELDT